MSKLFSGVSALVFAGFVGVGAAHAETKTITFLFTDDDQGYVERMAELSKEFESTHPDVKVNFVSSGYDAVAKQLPVQLAVGEGPDLAKITDWQLAPYYLDMRPYMKDAEGYAKLHGASLEQLRLPSINEPSSINGYVASQTLNLPFVNKTLFEQAGVAMPGEGATWDDWVEASAEVAEALDLPAAFAIDRSGHRISGPNVSYGADYVLPDGMPAPVDDGVRTFVGKLVGWTEEGKMLEEVWVSAAGSTYRAAADDFINAQIPFYYSGSWQVANLSTKIGDAFDWVATGSPCGTEACSGLAGGAALVAVKYTRNPEEVAKVMEYLASEPVVREFTERTLFLPAHQGIVQAGELQFDSDDPNVQPALDKFIAASQEIAPAAAKLPPWKWANAYYAALVTRTSQVMAGELSLEDAFARMDQDIADQVAQAQR